MVPLVLVAGGIVALRERDQRASADSAPATSPGTTTTPAPVHGQDDAGPIEVPEPAATTPTTRPTPSTLEPDPVVPRGASKVAVTSAATVAVEHVLAGREAAVTVLGQGEVPASGVSAVAVSVTVTGATAAGQITVAAPGGPPSAAATVDVAGPGDSGSGFVIVPVGPAGDVVLSSTVEADVALSTEGWFVPSEAGSPDGRFTTVVPSRVLDTTIGIGAVELPLAGDTGVPATGASALLVQITASEADAPGSVAAWPTGNPEPGAPVVTLPAPGWTTSNLALVPLGETGKVSIQSSAPAHLSVDVLAWITDESAPATTDGLFVPLPAARVVDTATTDGGPLDVRLRRDLTMGDRGGLPPFGAQVALGRVSATGPVASGSVALYPGGTARPEAATLHVRSDGRPTTTSAWLRLGQRGTLSAWADARTDLTVDVAGYVVGRPIDPDPVVAPVAPTTAGSDPAADFDAVIDRFLRNYGVPGASVAVAQDGRVVYARGYGTADVATGEPVRVDSRFRYASTSKVLTAAAVLDLVQSGQLQLTTPAFPLIAATAPLPPDADARLNDVTVADLLGHTSGLPASPDVFFNEGGQAPQTCADAARWVVTRRLVGTPGQGFSYVNMNFCVLSLVVEAVTGEPYASALQERVLDPRHVHDVAVGLTAGRQRGEVASTTGDPSSPGVGWFMESLLGAGGLVGTATDLVRVVDGLDPAKAGEHLLDPATFSAMLAPGPGSWGLGVRLFGPGTFGHTGSLAGARDMVVHQADGITWAITTNGSFDDHGSVLYRVMSQALASVSAWPAYDLSPDLP